MKMTGNTIFITGGGSGIGRGLAEAFHKRGNQIIISGRRKKNLADAVKANPGMESIELDVQDAESISAVAKELAQKFPELNVLINNAGIIRWEIAPPWVQTDLLNSNNEPRAMPLADFIRETMALLDSDQKEIVVERGRQLRHNVGRSEGDFVTQFNEMMEQPQ